MTGHLASGLGSSEAVLKTQFIVSLSDQADTGKIWTCRILGGPEVSLETFNQIKMSYVLSVYPKKCLYKIRKKRGLKKCFSSFAAFRMIQSIKIFLCIIVVP